MAEERSSTPVHRNLREEAVLDLVPLARARRKMGDAYLQAGNVGEVLQARLPKPVATAVAAAAVGSDQEFGGIWMGLLPHVLPPAFDAGHREFCRIVIDAHAYPALVASDVVDPVRNGFAELLVDEIMDANTLGFAERIPFRPAFLKSPTSSFFLASTEMTGSPAAKKSSACALRARRARRRDGEQHGVQRAARRSRRAALAHRLHDSRGPRRLQSACKGCSRGVGQARAHPTLPGA